MASLISSRSSMPRDDDAPGRCAICQCLYLGCEETSGCCPSIAPLTGQSFGGKGGSFDINVQKASPGKEFLCFAWPLPCSLCSMYIPDYVKDALGWEHQSTILCFQTECLGNTLPERDGPEYEEIMLKTLGQVKLVKPTVCVSQKSRFGFTMCKQSIPHSEDVPMSIACFGQVLCGENDSKECEYIVRFHNNITVSPFPCYRVHFGILRPQG